MASDIRFCFSSWLFFAVVRGMGGVMLTSMPMSLRVGSGMGMMFMMILLRETMMFMLLMMMRSSIRMPMT